MALRLGIDLGIFRALIDNNNIAMSTEELASKSQAEMLLIGKSKL